MLGSAFLSVPILAVLTQQPLDLANWMGALEPIVGNNTLLDLSVPGSHDSMTFDLSTTLSDGYEGLPAGVSKILHTLTPIVAGGFIREQGQTQGLNMTQQLENGIRFIDFRIMYTARPSTPNSDKDWYCLHGCQTEHTAITYLKEARAFLDAHPKEILTFWASRHGDNRPEGTDQYPDTTPAIRQAFFHQVEAVFEGLLFDTSQGALNTVSLQELWKRNQRVIWYAADYAQSTANSTLAMDGNFIDNTLPGAGDGFGSIGAFRSGQHTLASDKAKNSYYLMSLAGSAPSCQIEPSAIIKFTPGKHANAIKECAECFKIPGMAGWCPSTLMDSSLINNYYNQRVLDAAYTEGEANPVVDFPNAIYIDTVDLGGTIRTGTQLLNPLGKDNDPPSKHNSTGYAYSATVVGATVRRLCRRQQQQQQQQREAASPACAALSASVAASRALHPLSLWDDSVHGRSSTWPTLPPP